MKHNGRSVNLILVPVPPFPTHLFFHLSHYSFVSSLCSYITPSLFHCRLKTCLFHKSFPAVVSLLPPPLTALMDYHLECFFSNTQLFFVVFLFFLFFMSCARLSCPSSQLLSAHTHIYISNNWTVMSVDGRRRQCVDR